MSTHVQSLVLNVQNLIYPLALLDVFHKKIIIPPIYISLIENVMEQNLVGFQNSMYLHVGTYIPYFGFSYGGIGSAPTMWPLMSNPLANLMAPPKPILGVSQAKIVIDCKETLDEDDVFLERKHYNAKNCSH